MPTLTAEAFSRRLGRQVTVEELGLGHVGGTPPSVATAGWDLLDPATRLFRLSSGTDRHGETSIEVYRLAALIGADRSDRVAGTGMTSDRAIPMKVGRAHVRSAHAMIKLFSDADHAFGGDFACAALRDYLATALGPWLRAGATPTVRRDLLVAAARLAYLAGFMCFDSGQHGTGQQFYLTSLQLSDAADDIYGRAVTLRALSVQARALGHLQEAVHLSEAAMRTARNRLPEGTRAFLVGQVAVSNAVAGDSHAALRHLSAAERYLERSFSATETIGAYHRASLAHQHAAVLFHVGDRRNARAALQRSIRHRPPTERRALAITVARLAELQLADGELEHACATWHRFLDDYPQLHSQRVRDRFTDLRALVRSHRRSTVAQALMHRASVLSASLG